MGGCAWWDRQRVESAPSWAPRHNCCLLGHFLLLCVDLLRQLAEDVVDLLVDGEVAAAQAVPAKGASPVRCLRLGAGRQSVVKLADHPVQQVETASHVVTAKFQFRMCKNSVLVMS